MTFRYIHAVFFSVVCLIARGQNFEGHYRVVTDMYSGSGEDGTLQKAVSLEYAGILYRKGNRYISFKRPLYLDKYPSGSIDVQMSQNRIVGISLFMDSVQSIYYKDFDSLLNRYRVDASGKGQVTNNYLQYFEPDARQWEILTDTKEVNGLKCQKARSFNRDGALAYEAWFCPDVEMQGGPMGVFGLPGLVVELDAPRSYTRWELTSYSFTVDIPDTIFWPAEFNQSFKQLAKHTKLGSSNKATKQQKLINIVNQ
jgi:GLPGLI family protein